MLCCCLFRMFVWPIANLALMFLQPMQALMTFGSNFAGVDDILVFNYVSPVYREVIARMQLREVIDASWKVHRLVLYASEAVARVIASCSANVSVSTLSILSASLI